MKMFHGTALRISDWQVVRLLLMAVFLASCQELNRHKRLIDCFNKYFVFQ